MTQEKKAWRELCWAIVNEQDSENLPDLAQRPLAVLDQRKSEDSFSTTNNALAWPKNNLRQ